MSKVVFDYPPYPYLLRVVEYCPAAAATYMKIWKDRDKDHKFHIYKENVKSGFLMSPTRFHNHLLMLVKEGLVSVDESPLMLSVELVGYDDNYDEFGEELEG